MVMLVVLTSTLIILFALRAFFNYRIKKFDIPVTKSKLYDCIISGITALWDGEFVICGILYQNILITILFASFFIISCLIFHGDIREYKSFKSYFELSHKQQPESSERETIEGSYREL